MKKFCLVLLSICGFACAEFPADVIQEIDQRIQHQINPSIVVGVYEQGQSHFYAQGLQNKALNIPASKNSVYEIGSISKTFTALLLAQKVQADELGLDDAVQDHWTQPFKLVDSDNQAITFKQLATHTSGLSRLPSNLAPFAKDPYADYDRDQLLQGVEKAKPNKAGTTYAYSNFGAGLLGETMAVVADRSYHDLVRTNILQPLNLTQTYTQLSDVPLAHLSQGYMGNKPATAWQFKALAGAGAIRSSIQDLLAYGVAHLNHPPGALKEAMTVATTVHSQQDQFQVGLGWHITTGGLIWHNGATGGFSSVIMIDPKNNKVVAGITNHNNTIEDIVLHLMDASKPMKEHDFPVAIDVDQLEQYTGMFNLVEPAKSVTIERRDDRLFFIAPKQPKYALTYIGDDTFKLNLAKVKLKFNHNDKGDIDSLELQGWGKPQRYEKIPKK